MSKNNKYWFSYKRYWPVLHYTHPPISWQGWLAVIIYILIFPSAAVIFLFGGKVLPFVIIAGLNILGYIVVNELKAQPSPADKWPQKSI